MFKALLVSLASLTALVGVATASANTDADWAIHDTFHQTTVNLSDAHGFPIEYWAGDCVVRFFGYPHTPDTATIRVSNAIPSYDILTNSITSCATSD